MKQKANLIEQELDTYSAVLREVEGKHYIDVTTMNQSAMLPVNCFSHLDGIHTMPNGEKIITEINYMDWETYQNANVLEGTYQRAKYMHKKAIHSLKEYTKSGALDNFHGTQPSPVWNELIEDRAPDYISVRTECPTCRKRHSKRINDTDSMMFLVFCDCGEVMHSMNRKHLLLSKWMEG